MYICARKDGANLEANELGQALGAAGAGEDAQHHLRQCQTRLGARGRNAVVARERKLETAAEAVAVDGRNLGLPPADGW